MSKRTRRMTPPAGRDRSLSAARPGSPGALPVAARPAAPEPLAEEFAAEGPGSSAREGGASSSTHTRPAGATPAGIAGSRAEVAAGTAGSRAGRRPRQRTYQRSFFDRYRSLIVGGGIVGGLLLFGAFVFLGSSSSAYACSSQLDPAAPAPSPSGSEPPDLGQVIPDMGRSHVNPGTQARYTYCPPGSGPHYNIAGRGPIAPRFYPPDSATEPQGWIHNLEHGSMVILYSCATTGSCTDADLDKLRALASNFPASPVCKIQGGVISPVIARFDTMKTKFAAVIWNRTLLLDELDIPKMLEFWDLYGERNNPERQCAPPTPTTTPSVTFGTESPAPSPAASPASS
ncbi:MAG: DUF3105 domain-containing protein [Chloroflexi bacterium]|nr:DUF3105 domain-containing protein [Chloroflexota bacterium]